VRCTFATSCDNHKELHYKHQIMTIWGILTMSASNEQEMLSQGLAALKAGDKTTAQTVLREVVKQNPRLIEAWMGLAQTTTDPARQRTCYENVLKIDPTHPAARAALATLGISAQEVESSSDDESIGESVESLRPKITPISSSPGFKPPQSIPGAPAQFTVDDLLAFMKNLLASLQGAAGQGGNAEALPASWWNIAILVVLAGAVTGFLSVLASILYGLIQGAGFNAGSILALVTYTLLTPLQMAAGLAGGTVLSRWFLQWRGKAEGSLLDHTMVLARPWFAGSIGLAVLTLLGSFFGSLGASTLESVLRYFSLTTTGFSIVILIISLILAIGVAYLVVRGWAKIHPDSLGTNRAIAAVLALLIITMAL
jgi:hypothetical protein